MGWCLAAEVTHYQRQGRKTGLGGAGRKEYRAGEEGNREGNNKPKSKGREGNRSLKTEGETYVGLKEMRGRGRYRKVRETIEQDSGRRSEG